MEVVLRHEARRQWRLLLERGQYGAALAHCRSATQRNRVYTVQAAAAFDAGQFERAAVLYARTPAAAPLEQARRLPLPLLPGFRASRASPSFTLVEMSMQCFQWRVPGGSADGKPSESASLRFIWAVAWFNHEPFEPQTATLVGFYASPSPSRRKSRAGVPWLVFSGRGATYRMLNAETVRVFRWARRERTGGAEANGCRTARRAANVPRAPPTGALDVCAFYRIRDVTDALLASVLSRRRSLSPALHSTPHTTETLSA